MKPFAIAILLLISSLAWSAAPPSILTSSPARSMTPCQL